MTADSWAWWIAAFLLMLDIVIRITAIIVIPRNRRPTAAMAWLLAIFFIPFVGVFLFLVIGNPRLPRARRRKQDQINEYIAETSEHLHFGTLRPNAPAWFGPIVQMNQKLGALPLSGDNGAHLISDYQESLDEMAEAIRTAQESVHVESYNLKKNIKRGLHWVDLMVRLDGPVVLSVNAIFVADWYSETDTVLEGIDIAHANIGSGDLDCQVVPSGPGFEVENNLRLFLALLYAAKKQIMIVSPYFVPDEALLLAVTAAVDRGVEVQLFVSEEGDQAMVYNAQRSYYEVLLKAGVRIWMYRKPYILHTKTLTIDEEVAVVGSSNMDMRSFGLNLEVSMLVRGEEFVAEMREVEDKYRSLSRELTLEEWMQQPLRSTVLDNLARLTSALQ